MAKKQLTMQEAQDQAIAYAKGYFGNHDFAIQGDEEQFKVTADAVLKALVDAWAEGFFTGRGK